MEAGKEIELRSEEVQEVMGQIPAWIVRWGVTSVAGCVVAGGYSVGLYESGIERYLCPRLPGFDWTVTGGDPCLGDVLLPGGAVGWKGKGRAAGDRAVYEFPGSGVRYREGRLSSVSLVPSEDNFFSPFAVRIHIKTLSVCTSRPQTLSIRYSF